MKKIIFGALVAMILAGCEVDYDKLSDNEKYSYVIEDIGISSHLSLDDVLRGVPTWVLDEQFLFTDSSRESVKSYISFKAEDNQDSSGGLSLTHYTFAFASNLTFYTTQYILLRPNYYGYFIEYDYKINVDNTIELQTNADILNEFKLPELEELRIIAFNIDRIAMEVKFTNGRYYTFILRRGNETIKQFMETNCVEFEAYEQAYREEIESYK
jgi:hypothetical protein